MIMLFKLLTRKQSVENFPISTFIDTCCVSAFPFFWVVLVSSCTEDRIWKCVPNERQKRDVPSLSGRRENPTLSLEVL